MLFAQSFKICGLRWERMRWKKQLRSEKKRTKEKKTTKNMI